MSKPGSIALVTPALRADAAAPPASSIAALTAGLAAGEEAAYREFFAAYAGRLRRYLLVVCRGDEQAAADALQETMLRVARHARGFADEDAFWRWLAALARSAAVDGARRRGRYAALLARYVAWFRPEPVAVAPADDEGRLNALLDLGLAALPAADRELLRQRYDNRCSVRDLAEAAGISEKAVESRLGRLRAHLRRRLLERLAHEAKD